MRVGLSLLALALVTASWGAPQNLVNNGTFEHGLSPKKIPLYWGEEPYGQELISRGFRNTQSLKISTDNFGDSIGAQTLSIPVSANTTLTLIGQIKGENIEPESEAWQGAKIQVLFLDSKGKELSPLQETVTFAGSFDWQLVLQNIIVPPGGTSAKILIGLWGAKGTVYYDDIMLYEIAKKKQAKPSTRINLVTNGDFELWGAWQFLGSGHKEIRFPGFKGRGQALYITNSQPVWAFAAQEIPLIGTERAFLLQGRIKYSDILAGKEKWQKGRVYAEYYDKDGKMLGSWDELLAVEGSAEWTFFSCKVVIPKEARSLKLYCGLQDASGEISFDELLLQPMQE